MELMAGAEHSLGLKAGMIAHCDLGTEGGMDEFSAAGDNLARGFGSLMGLSERWSPEEMGVAETVTKGGGVAENSQIFIGYSPLTRPRRWKIPLLSTRLRPSSLLDAMGASRKECLKPGNCWWVEPFGKR